MKKLMLFLVLLSGCVTTRQVPFKVETIPPGAAIDANNMNICDEAPCEIRLECKERYMDGWISLTRDTITASPPVRGPASGSLYTSSKTVDPCLIPKGATGSLRFDLRLEKTNAVTPIEIRNR